MQIAIAHVPESTDLQLQTRCGLRDEGDHLCKLAARDGDVLQNGSRLDASQC